MPALPGVLLAFVLLAFATVPVIAAPAPGGPSPVRPALDQADLLALERAADAGRSHVTLLIAAEEDGAPSVAAGVRALGGAVEVRFNRVGYVRARVPLENVERAARLAAVEAVDIERRIPIEDPSPQGSLPAIPQPPPSAATPRSNPYLPLQDIAADTFGEAPGRDGRGITLAVLDTGVDLAHEALQTTPAGRPKVIDWVNAIPPGAGDATWVSTSGRHSGEFSAEGIDWVAPEDGHEYAFGTLVEDRGDLAGGEVKGDLNRNGVIGETIGVLQNRDNLRVIVDANMNRDFTDDPVLRDYRVAHERGFLGVDDPLTPVEERMAYTVDTRHSSYGQDGLGQWVNIGIAGNSHGTHVAGIAAGHELFGGEMAGSAPGAQVISVKVCPTSGGCSTTAMTEGMLYAAEAGADIANMSVGGISLLNDGGDAQSEIYDRIVEDYGMSIFVAAGNDGPGSNTAAHPSVARNVNSVAAGVSAETWLSNYGQEIANPYSLFTFSSRGPALNGALKPEMTAPGAAIAPIPPWQPGGAIDGIYPLPPGYAMYNGTSMAAPQAAGAAALLAGASLERFGETPSPEELRNALLSSADPVPGAPAYGQGAGLIDTEAAWEVLQAIRTGSPPVDIEARVPIDHVLSGLLKPEPGFGPGIYDRENVIPGQSYTRTVELTRTSGPAGPRTFEVSAHGDLDVTVPATVTLPLNEPAPLEVEIDPGEPGIRSSLIRVDDPTTDGVDLLVPATVFSAAPPEVVRTVDGTVPQGGDRSLAFRVPPGTEVLRLELEGGGPEPEAGQIRFTVIEPTGMPLHRLGGRDCFIPDMGTGCPAGDPAVRTIVSPTPGVWEVTVQASRSSSAPEASYAVTGTLLDASVSPDPDLIRYRGPGPVERSYTATNHGGRFTGRVEGGALAAVRRHRPTIEHRRYLELAPIDVTAGAESLTVSIGNPAVEESDLDLFLFDCSATPCTEVGRAAAPGAEETVRLADPPPGNYVAVVDGYDVPGGSTEFDYSASITHPAFGNVRIDDTDAPRETGATWTVPGTVTVGQPPEGDWSLGGELRVLDTDGHPIGRSQLEFELDPDPPVVTITSGPPPSGSERTVTFEFTVDDPAAETYCRLDGSNWEACASPQTYSDLGDGDEGEHTFEVRARDLAGWGEAASSTFVITAASAIAAEPVTAVTGPEGSRITPTARLTRERDGLPVTGRTVTFGLGGTDLCQAVTDPTGRASCEAALPGPARDGDRYEARFAGDARFGGSTAGAPVRVPAQPGPHCPAVRLGIALRGFQARPPWGQARRALGVRVQATAGRRVIARIAPRIRYRLRGTTRVANLQRRTIRINGSRQLRFQVPRQMRVHYRRAGKRLVGSRVTFVLHARVRLAGTPAACDQLVRVRPLPTRVVGVSSRVALRRLGIFAP